MRDTNETRTRYEVFVGDEIENKMLTNHRKSDIDLSIAACYLLRRTHMYVFLRRAYQNKGVHAITVCR